MHLHRYRSALPPRQLLVRGIKVGIQLCHELLTLCIMCGNPLDQLLLDFFELFPLLFQFLRRLLHTLLIVVRQASVLLICFHQLQHLIFKLGNTLLPDINFRQNGAIFLIGFYLPQAALRFDQLYVIMIQFTFERTAMPFRVFHVRVYGGKFFTRQNIRLFI